MMRKILVVSATVVLILAQCPPAIFAHPIVSTKTEYYDIRGSTARELRNQMNKLGAKGSGNKIWDGFTDWHIEWRYWYKETPDGCRMTKVRIWVNITFTFPKWPDQAAASRALKERWNKFITALRIHEAGHRNIAVDAAARIEKAITHMGSRIHCGQLEEDADALGHRILEECRKEQERYDARTRHGVTQGTKFP